MILILYLVVCGFSFGMYDAAALIEVASPWGRLNAEDILLVVLLLVTAPAYMRQRRELTFTYFKYLEFSWVVFIAMLAAASLYSPASTTTERLVNLRFVQGYLLFFPSVAILTSETRVMQIAIVLSVFAIAGTVLTVAQSLHGLTNLFDSPFYEIGGWEGNKQMVAGIARVNLPISHLVAFVLVVLFPWLLLQWRWSVFFLAGFLLLTILVNFARSLWLAMTAAFILEIVFLYMNRMMSLRQILVLLWLPFGLVFSLALAPYIGLENLSAALLERLGEGLYFFTAKAGTYGVRLEQTEAAFNLWKENWLFGVGTNYYAAYGGFLDVGIAITLLSVGLFGTLLIFWLLFVCSRIGYATMKEGFARGSLPLVLIGIAVPAEVVILIVYQQWMTTPTVASIMGFASALAVIAPLIIDVDEEETEEAVEDESVQLSNQEIIGTRNA